VMGDLMKSTALDRLDCVLAIPRGWSTEGADVPARG
jgi:hypothetical protein